MTLKFAILILYIDYISKVLCHSKIAKMNNNTRLNKKVNMLRILFQTVTAV